MEVKDIMKKLYTEDYAMLPDMFDDLHMLLYSNYKSSQSIKDYLITKEFLEEIMSILERGNIQIYFGKTLRDLKCVLKDSDGAREHEIFLKYTGPKKLQIVSVNLPDSSLLDELYYSLEDLEVAFKNHVSELSHYFYELELIDRFCSVMEPVKPTFKENYRRIFIDDKTWLHVEVSPEGFAKNVHLVGQSEQWQDKLEFGLKHWNHDKDIVENIMTVFDLINFPKKPDDKDDTPELELPELVISDELEVIPLPVVPIAPTCGICLSIELPGISGVPQPLCQNSNCGVYFHRTCLLEWLVACSGGRPPAFGVATGSCPACLQTISCNEGDK